MTMKLYVLELVGNRYYVGTSDNVEERIKAHFEGHGARWTQLYPPIEVIKIISTDNPL